MLNNKAIAFIGKMSFSIYIWHQLILAFYRYFITNELTVISTILFLVVVMALSYITYRYVEQKIKTSKSVYILFILCGLMNTLLGCLVYLKAGVVRDVPELNITTENAHRGMHGEYCDRVYDYDKDFSQEVNGRINVLVVGISYGRDMGNILLESKYADSINLSYVYKWDSQYINRIKDADVILNFSPKIEVPDYVWSNKKQTTEVWGIGTKHFGLCNGVTYCHRFDDDYFERTEPLHPIYKKINEEWAKQWGDKYIDFIVMSQDDKGQIRVFTDDHKYISQDCYHLTQAGAKWFANKINFEKILSHEITK